jgi:peptidyl-dipeptidase Dcp
MQKEASASSAHQAALGEVERLRAEAANDPMLAEWSGPYGGVPPWDRAKAELFPAAFERGLALLKAEVAAIAADPAPPTFANTVEALERSDRTLGRVAAVFFGIAGADTNEALEALQRELSPRLAAHRADGSGQSSAP